VTSGDSATPSSAPLLRAGGGQRPLDPTTDSAPPDTPPPPLVRHNRARAPSAKRKVDYFAPAPLHTQRGSTLKFTHADAARRSTGTTPFSVTQVTRLPDLSSSSHLRRPTSTGSLAAVARPPASSERLCVARYYSLHRTAVSFVSPDIRGLFFRFAPPDVDGWPRRRGAAARPQRASLCGTTLLLASQHCRFFSVTWHQRFL